MSREPKRRRLTGEERSAAAKAKRARGPDMSATADLRVKGHSGKHYNGVWYELEPSPDLLSGVEASGLSEEHRANMEASRACLLKPKTWLDYAGRLLRMALWFLTEYPDSNSCIVYTTQQMTLKNLPTHVKTRLDPNMPVKYINVNYECIEPTMVEAFVGAHKEHKGDTRRQGSHMSPVQLLKFYDAIKGGAGRYNKVLKDFSKYEAASKKAKSGFRKECVKKKQLGDLDSYSADPVPFRMHRAACKGFLESGQLMEYAWQSMEWNLMGRSQACENLTYESISVVDDALRIAPVGGKGDQLAQRNTYKHVYGNPYDLFACNSSALALYLMLDKVTDDNFVWTARKNAGNQFRAHWAEWLVDIGDIAVSQWVRPTNASCHGNRKGATTHAGTQTIAAPPLGSICRRAEWKLGQILEIYMNFGDAGDRYLGRILAGLDPNYATFAIAPPHWTCPPDDEDLTAALSLAFGHLLENQPDFRGVCAFCLASLVHHLDQLLHVIGKSDDHVTRGFPLFQNLSLLKRLKAKVTTKTDENITVTGIPPHVLNMVALVKLCKNQENIMQLLHGQEARMLDAVKKAIDDRDTENGLLSLSTFEEQLKQHWVEVQSFFRHHQAGGQQLPEQQVDQEVQRNSEQEEHDERGYPNYMYGSGIWQVPRDFVFPKKIYRRDAWDLWLIGSPDGFSAPIRPFRLLDPGMLPKTERRKYNQEWAPIMKLMEEVLNASHATDDEDWLTTTDLVEARQEFYDETTRLMRTHGLEYIYASKSDDIRSKIEKNPEDWSIATWSCKISKGYIAKYGTDTDRDMSNTLEAQRNAAKKRIRELEKKHRKEKYASNKDKRARSLARQVARMAGFVSKDNYTGEVRVDAMN